MKSSLRYINPDSVSVGTAHHVWTSVHDNIHDSRRTQLKCRLLTGKYTLKSNRAMFNQFALKVSKVAKIRNRYNQVPHLTQDTNGKVTNSQKTPQTRAKRSALSQQMTTKHI